MCFNNVFFFLSLKYLTKRARGMAQVIEHLLSKCEALSSNFSTPQCLNKTFLLTKFNETLTFAEDGTRPLQMVEKCPTTELHHQPLGLRDNYVTQAGLKLSILLP
jgi:hypothetical protein